MKKSVCQDKDRYCHEQARLDLGNKLLQIKIAFDVEKQRQKIKHLPHHHLLPKLFHSFISSSTKESRGMGLGVVP